MTILQNQAVNVRPPRQGEFFRFALTASTVVYGIPSAWTTKYVTIKAVGGTLQYQCGKAGDTLSLTFDAVGSGTTTPTANNASGKNLADGQEDCFRITQQEPETQIAVISDGTAGFVEFYLSSQPDSL